MSIKDELMCRKLYDAAYINKLQEVECRLITLQQLLEQGGFQKTQESSIADVLNEVREQKAIMRGEYDSDDEVDEDYT